MFDIEKQLSATSCRRVVEFKSLSVLSVVSAIGLASRVPFEIDGVVPNLHNPKSEADATRNGTAWATLISENSMRDTALVCSTSGAPQYLTIMEGETTINAFEPITTQISARQPPAFHARRNFSPRQLLRIHSA
jgi:hypothetical protein